MTKQTIAVLCAGAFGTAVAVHLARANHRVLLWGRDGKQIEAMMKTRTNSSYLPDIVLPTNIEPSLDLTTCLTQASQVILAAPSKAFTSIFSQMTPPAQGLCWLTKGLVPKTHQFFSQYVAAHWGEDYPVAVVSGPSFAEELALGLPTAITIAGNHLAYQQSLQALLHHSALRAYLSTDLIGVQLCGAIKNILAIACGVSDGLHCGANARAALITRGLAEMSRLGIALGAKEKTFMGLAGIGDLVLTCTDDQSRNRRFGLYIGQGLSPDQAERKMGQVIEGKQNVSQVCALAQAEQVDLPICMEIQALLRGQISPTEALTTLMTRAKNEE